jgi:CO/xanthine dehydrogenase FAD-binding subunit
MLADSKILPVRFRYLEPCNLADTLNLCLQSEKQAAILAGGTDLLIKIKRGLVQPEILIGLRQVSELQQIQTGEEGLRLGAAVTLYQAEHFPAIQQGYSALHEALRSMAAPALRNMATLGGNLCNASPAADTAPPLLIFDAQLHLQKSDQERLLPLAQFFTGPGSSRLMPGELLTEIVLPAPLPDSGSAFLKLGRVSCDIAKVNVATYLARQGTVCILCRVAVGSVAPTPVRIASVEQLLDGAVVDLPLLRQAAEAGAQAIVPIDDIRSTAQYRRQVCRVMLEEALQAAWIRAGGVL